MVFWFVVGNTAASAPACQHGYRERPLGDVDGSVALFVHCEGGPWAEVRWRGAGGLVTTSLIEEDLSWEADVDDVVLADGIVSYTLLQHQPRGVSIRSEWTLRVGDANPVRIPEAPVDRIFQESLVARDWVVAASTMILETYTTNPWPDITDNTFALARAVRDVAVQERSGGQERAAADRVLGMLASRTSEAEGEYQLSPGPGHEGIFLDLQEPTQLEVANDLGFLLDEGGEHDVAVSILRTVVDAAGTSRPVALLNLADALWSAGSPEAGRWYQAYLDQITKPVKRAKKRTHTTPPAPAPETPDAAARFEAALAQDDFLRARGAALSGGWSPLTRASWWSAGRRHVQARLGAGDPATILPVLDYLSHGLDQRPDLAGVRDELKALARVACGVDGGIAHVERWLGEPADLEEAMLLARCRPSERADNSRDRYKKALTIGEASALVGIQEINDDFCVTLLGHRTTHRCSGTQKYGWKAMPRMQHPSCSQDQWPCFAVTGAAGPHGRGPVAFASDPSPGTEARWHACGVDLLGELRCHGTDAVSTPPDAGPGFRWAATSENHGCALHEDHRAVCWGDNDHGQAPSQIPDVVTLAVGSGWTCYIGLDGRLHCLGEAPTMADLPELPDFLGPDDYRTFTPSLYQSNTIPR